MTKEIVPQETNDSKSRSDSKEQGEETVLEERGLNADGEIVVTTTKTIKTTQVYDPTAVESVDELRVMSAYSMGELRRATGELVKLKGELAKLKAAYQALRAAYEKQKEPR